MVTRRDWWLGVSLIVVVLLALTFVPRYAYRSNSVPDVNEETGGPLSDWGAIVREYGTPVDWPALARERDGTTDYAASEDEGSVVEAQSDRRAEPSWFDLRRREQPSWFDQFMRLPSPDEVRALAEQGSFRAQQALGFMYEEGRGVTQDYAEAVRWFRLPADQGFAPAQFFLGNSLTLGRGVPQDYVEAHMWLNLSGHDHVGPEDRDTYANARDAVTARMTADQIAEAQRRAQEWTPTPQP